MSETLPDGTKREKLPLFADMAYQRQKAIIAAKVDEFKGRIVLIDETPDTGAMEFQDNEEDLNDEPQSAN